MENINMILVMFVLYKEFVKSSDCLMTIVYWMSDE